jgi:hypothetical protein
MRQRLERRESPLDALDLEAPPPSPLPRSDPANTALGHLDP